MPSLQNQLTDLKGGRVILWLDHPELKSVNGTLVDVQPEHVAVVVDSHTYLVPYSAIVAARAAGEPAPADLAKVGDFGRSEAQRERDRR